MRKLIVAMAAALFCWGTPLVHAQLQSGNIVVTVDGLVKEYQLDGTLVQNIGTVPQPEGGDSGPRDLIVDGDGKLLIYNGTFLPNLSTLDMAAGTWQHRRIEGWATIANISYGGIGIYEDTVFLTDMIRSHNDIVKGIIAYDREDDSWTVLDTYGSPIDLCVGLDGFLYVLYTGGRLIDVYDPANGCFIRRIFPEGSDYHRAVAVDRESNIFLVGFNGVVKKLDPSGKQTKSVNLANRVHPNLTDIDVDGFGNVVVGSRMGNVVVLNSHLAFINWFEAGFSTSFVAFAESSPLDGKRTYYGTPGDDQVVFDQERRQITINDITCLVPDGMDVRFMGGPGNDSVTFRGRPGEIDLAVLENQTMKVNCPDCEFFALESEVLEFVGTDPMDVALINDTPGVDQLDASIHRATLQTDLATLTANGVANVYVFSDQNSDRANYRGTRLPESLRCSLEIKRVRAMGQNSYVMMQGFEHFFSNGSQSPGDHAIVTDTTNSDYLYSRADYTRIMNGQYDYTFRGYDILNVWSDGSGFDRARYQATEGSEFLDNGIRAQQVGPGFKTSVFGFDENLVIDR